MDWFFLRLSTIYGAKFRSQFTSQAEIQLAKMEWRKQILVQDKRKLHQRLETAKASQDLKQYQWPNIGLILKTPINSPDGSNSQAYIPIQPALPAPARDRSKDVNRMQAIRELMR